MPDAARKWKCLACEIIYREACLLAAKSPHRVDVAFLPKGLHDVDTPEMVRQVQAAVDAVDPDAGYEAILLGYARCNDGLVGIRAGGIPLVLPRAHDCITLFFGSRQAYRAYFDAHPGTYYLTTGWCERNRADGAFQPQDGLAGPGEEDRYMGMSYREIVAKYGQDNADYIIETLGGWEKNYSRLTYVEMGVCDESRFVEAGRRRAEEHGWDFERHRATGRCWKNCSQAGGTMTS